jgi:3-dehydroquinate dehydratase
MNWKNVNLQGGYERDQNILGPYSFDTLLLECHCNIPMQNVNRETVKQQFETELNNKIREAREIFADNLDNIVKQVNKENKD